MPGHLYSVLVAEVGEEPLVADLAAVATHLVTEHHPDTAAVRPVIA